MTTTPFTLLDGGNLILVEGKLDEDNFTWALDTAASHTILDLTKLILAGYSVEDFEETVKLETAKGVVEAEVLRVKSISALGITAENIAITSYDFLAYGILAEYDGLIGLDFLKGKKICIDFREMEISIG